MFATIKRLYNKTGSKDLVRAAVNKYTANGDPWITKEQYKEITGEVYA